jgi:high affinity Mn2+ porin
MNVPRGEVDPMKRLTPRWSLLALLLVFLAGPGVFAQTVDFGSRESGEGGSGKTIGGNIPAAPASVDEQNPPAESWYSAHAQATVILEGLAPFHSPYVGPNSLVSAYELRTTSSATLFFAAKLPWEGGLLIINPEVYGGLGVGDVFGLGAPPNGETQRVGDPAPSPYFARFLYQQTISLGGEWERLADIANQIPEPRYNNNIVFKVGRFAVSDDFDDNTFSHDPRTQFMNWGLQYNPTFDFPANVRGYTYGTMTEINLAEYSARYGIFAVSSVANGAQFDPHIGKAHGQALEVERRWTILNDLPGSVRLLGWVNNAHMGSYSAAILENPQAPAVTQTEVYRARPGCGLSWDQELIKNELGIFGRLGWSDGRYETWEYTECDRTFSIGMLLKGKNWDRPKDEVGFAFICDGLGRDHRAYLAAGGLGFELGDGKLNYAPEMVLETYYNFRLRKGIFVTIDLQGIDNPGYNHDRGPVGFIGLRTHIEF